MIQQFYLSEIFHIQRCESKDFNRYLYINVHSSIYSQYPEDIGIVLQKETQESTMKNKWKISRMWYSAYDGTLFHLKKEILTHGNMDERVKWNKPIIKTNIV